MDKHGFLVIILMVGAVVWVLDTLVSSEEAIEDEEGNIIGFKPGKYKGLWDYLKQKWHKGGIR